MFILYYRILVYFFQVYADYEYYRRKDIDVLLMASNKALQNYPTFYVFLFFTFYIQDSICILARFICHPIKAPLRTTVEKELNSLKENFTNAVKKDKQDKDHIDAPPESARDILNRVINDFSSELVMNYVRDHTKYLYK